MTHDQHYFDNPTTTTTTTTTQCSSSPSSTTMTTLRSGSSSSSSTSRYTEPGVSSAVDNLLAKRQRVEEDFKRIKKAYQGSIGESIRAGVARYIEDLYYVDKIDAGVIIHALEETGWARKPTPQYFRAIMERYKRDGITTMIELTSDREEHESHKTWYEDWDM